MTNLTKAIVATVLTVALVATACGDDTDDGRVGATIPPGSVPEDGSDDEDTADVEPVEEADDVVRGYFDALATSDLSRMGAMTELATEDSPAHLYAVHQIALQRASTYTDPGVNDWSEASVEQCVEGFDETGEIVTECVLFADFELGGEGLLVSFTVDGVSVTERIATAADATESQGVAARVVTAYESARGDLFVNVDVTNSRAAPLVVTAYDWSLITADGRQVSVDETVQSADLSWFETVAPGATAGVVAVFPQTPLGAGGTLHFTATRTRTSTPRSCSTCPCPLGAERSCRT